MYEVHQHINPETQTTTTTRGLGQDPANQAPQICGVPPQATFDEDHDDDDDSNPINHFGKSEINYNIGLTTTQLKMSDHL